MRKYAQIGLAAWEFDAVCLLLLCGDHRPLFGPALLLTLVPVHNHTPPTGGGAWAWLPLSVRGKVRASRAGCLVASCLARDNPTTLGR